jgi:predicted hydrocarbon binding protein
MDLTQLLEQDDAKGTIRFRQTGIRANLLSSKAWASMKEKMFLSFGSGAASILFGLGQFYGSEALGSLGKLQEKPFDIFQYAVSFGLATGWGRITPEFSGDMLTVRVENCCFCEGIKMTLPICYELAGIISAALSSVSKEQIPVKEVQCIAKGDSHCSFRAGVTESLRKGLRTPS